MKILFLDLRAYGKRQIDIIAKGVETEEQKRFLIETACMHMQGYIYAKPMVASKMEEMFKIKCHNAIDMDQ